MEFRWEQEPHFKEEATIDIHVVIWISHCPSIPCILLFSPTGTKHQMKYLFESQINTTVL